KAVQTSSSLSLLSDIVPPTITLANARQRRIDRETDPTPQDPLQKMLNHVNEQIRRAGKSFAGHTNASGSSQAGNGGGNGGHGKGPALSRNPASLPSPFTTLLHHPGAVGGPTPLPPRTISPREARALSGANNSKKSGANAGANANTRPLAPMPLGSKLPPMGAIPVGMPMGPGGAIPVHMGPMGNILPGPPPGFDYRNMPMAFAPAPLPPGTTVDPELYRNGIRWAPVQAGAAANGGASSTGQSKKSKPVPAKKE
ncbi:15391_t:CDS:2, partial [Acaulospora colombiana]